MNNRLEDLLSIAKFIDVKIPDLKGKLHHITLPVRMFDKVYKKGIGMDGSSFPGFLSTERSDLIVRINTDFVFFDPIMEYPTISFFTDIYTTDGELYPLAPTSIYKKTIAKFKEQTGIDDISILPEFEFYIFSNLKLSIKDTECSVKINVEENPEEYSMHNAYHISPPIDKYYNLRSKIVDVFQEVGIDVKYHHHEVGPSAQNEIEIDYVSVEKTPMTIMLVIYLIKNLVLKEGLYVSFLPKPLRNQAGSGLHLHFKFKDYKEEYRYFIGGLLKYAPSLCLFTNPSTNSYKRLYGGHEAPSRVFYSSANRNAAIRIPGYAKDGFEFEYRVPDATFNPYLALALIWFAQLEGFNNAIDPGPPVVKGQEDNVCLPENLIEAVKLFLHENTFIDRSIFPQMVIDNYIEWKKEENRIIAQSPLPYEFFLYE